MTAQLAAGVKAVPGAKRPWARYLGIALTTALCMLGLYGAALGALSATGNLPPPAFVNSLCADAKLQHIRDNPPEAPTSLIVGSSIAWRNFDSNAIVQQAPAARPLNAGVCGLRTNQTEFVTDFFLHRYPSVQRVLFLISPDDLLRCSRTNPRLFNPADVSAYLSRRDWLWFDYLRYFDPVSLARNAISLRAKEANRIPLDPLVFNRFSDGPLQTDESRGIMYGKFGSPDPACLKAVHDLAQSVEAGGRHILVATSPLSPEWLHTFDQDASFRDDFASAIQASLKGTGAEFWDGVRQAQQPQAAFTDEVHMRWSGAKRFSTRLVEATNFGIATR